MKTIDLFCVDKNLKCVEIRYRHQFGYIKRKGFDLIDDNGYIKASFEPVDYSNGDKWHLRNGKSELGSYFKRISKSVLESLDLNYENHLVLSQYMK